MHACIYTHAKVANRLRHYLQEAADCLLISRSHGHHILIEPEEGPLLSRWGLGIGQHSEELKEQPACPLWGRGE